MNKKGPVAPLCRVKDSNDMIRISNDTHFGLQAGIFTNDLQLAFHLARRLEVGGVVINGTPAFRPGNVPFGGWKQSGMGRGSLLNTIEEFTQGKTIVLNHVIPQ